VTEFSAFSAPKGVPDYVPPDSAQFVAVRDGLLNAARRAGLLDEAGYPRLAASFGGGGTPTAYMGTLPALLAAWGPVDMSFGSGQGVKCYHSEHLYGELWHRAFTVSPDTPLCDAPPCARSSPGCRQSRHRPRRATSRS